MKRVLNKFADTSSNNTTILLITFFLISVLSSYIFFQSFKENLLKNAKQNYTSNIKSLNNKLDKELILNNKKDIQKEIDELIKTKLFKEIILEYDRFVFNKNSLISNSTNFNDKSWDIAEVIVDARYGYIQKIEKSDLYEFIPSSTFDLTQPINIRYQVYKKDEIKNIITKFNFSNISIKNFSNENIEVWFNSLQGIDTSDKIFDIKIDEITIATIVYKVDSTIIKEELQSFVTKLIFFTMIMFFPILFLIGFYHKYIFKKYVTNPIVYLNSYLDSILENRFKVLDKSNFEGTKEIKELTKKVSKISSKIASLKNELNINKESLELKVSTDGLTGLPNKGIFDFDIKSMFVSLVKGYVFIVRIDQLAQLSKNHDSGYINSFVESYVNIIKNIIFKYSKTDMKLYRFYGSQFAIIGKNLVLEDAIKMCEEIIEEIKDRMPDIYDTPEDLVQIGGTSFDLYGSLETIIASANNAYEKSKAKGANSYYIIGEEDIEKNYSLLDNSVIEVIEKGEFDISFVLDSFSFDNPDKLVMSEVSPLLYDHDNKKLSVGSFVSVAQKLDIADDFDKLVIQKAISYIKEHEITHEVAINLSISSIENKLFMKWLDNILKENSDILEKVVFSITSYTAYLHKSAFIDFVKDIHDIGAKVLLKRYKTDEYPLDQLENLNLDYIRINKDYTINFTNDMVKKHKVKNVLIFAELNNIKVITDSVKLDLDYDLLERLGTYATSR
ncbi:EAL domain-containing protein [Arcobacter sp. LA11]|uniref:EAL domain-containing protein n=1 Tax=Arcobacter sp. LA11 TaxID=1898176 RepID=UPI0009333A34|nr:EAL domain-containing protein [Arcobacter sp. LA11]